MSSDSVIAVTGLGVLSAIGRNIACFSAALAAGRRGMRPLGLVCARIRSPVLREHLAGTLEDPAWEAALAGDPRDAGEGEDPSVLVALPPVLEAWRDAALDRSSISSRRRALVMGTSGAGVLSRSLYEHADREERARRYRLLGRSDPATVTAALARALGIEGPILTVTTACTASTNAVVHARDLLLSDLVDVVIAGGVDVLSEEVIAGFHAMGAISRAPCAPFSLPVGLTLGEGAGFLALERAEHAAKRGARIRCFLAGTGLSQDGWHATAPEPNGGGVCRAIAQAIEDANMTPDDIEYVNAHGTGTEANDSAEWRGIDRALGPRAVRVPVSATKSYLGHALGAAGALELIATILSLEMQVVPPTLNFTGLRGAGPADVVGEPVPRRSNPRIALKTSSGFGGANAAVVVARSRLRSPPCGRTDRRDVTLPAARVAPLEDVVIVGTGALGAFGFRGYDELLRGSVPAWDRVPAGAARNWLGRVPALSLARMVRGVDLRGMPVLARHLLVVTHLALEDADVVVRGSLHERAGLFVGAQRIGWDVAAAFWGSIRERGYERVSAPAFAQLGLNAPAGMVSASLGLRGPQTVIAGGRGSTLAALALATTTLARRPDADLIVVGSAAELADAEVDNHAVEFPDEPAARAPFAVYGGRSGSAVLSEGAASVVVTTRKVAAALGSKPLARVAGIGASGPGGLSHALGQAMASARFVVEDVDAVYGCADGSIAAAAAEVTALRAILGSRSREVALVNPAPLVGTTKNLDGFSLCAAVEALRRGRPHRTAGCVAPGLRLDGGGALSRLVVVCDAPGCGAWAIALETDRAQRHG